MVSHGTGDASAPGPAPMVEAIDGATATGGVGEPAAVRSLEAEQPGTTTMTAKATMESRARTIPAFMASHSDGPGPAAKPS